MAFSLGERNNGRSRFHGTGTLSEINVVPLVDVVLVLLIIFMLTAHVMEYGLEVDVPKVKPSRNSVEDLPMVTVSPAGEIALNEDRSLNIHELADRIHRRFPKTKAVYVRADKTTTWDTLAQVVAELGEAKFDIRMVTQPEEQSKQRSQ